jgi:arginine/lysine/ornithine decarboxylase
LIQICTTEELRQDSKLWYKLHVFVYGLRKIRSNEKSRERLDSVINTYYMGPPYFTATEADRILHTIDDEGRTLKETLDGFFARKLEKRMQSRMKETADYRVCAAHDLAPILENASRIHTKDLKKNKGFMKLLRNGALSALDDGRVWKGLGKR